MDKTNKHPKSHKWLMAMALCATGLTATAASIQDGGEYYIVGDYYNMALGLDTLASDTPALTAFGKVTTTDAYVFIAEKSADPAYFYLKNKATGQYLTASTANKWSLVWKTGKGQGNEYLWKVNVQMGRTISSKKDAEHMLGMDWSTDSQVKAYYNKSYNSTSRFTVVPVVEGGGLTASLSVAETDTFVNEIGRREKDVYQMQGSEVLTDTIDLHLVSQTPFKSVASINIKNNDAWVIFDNVSPSKVIEKWLPFIKVNGIKAQNNVNVRVAIYLDGAAVIPYKKSNVVFTGYKEADCQGDKVELTCKNNTTLKANNNMLRSFVLKRGNMAVVASGLSGEGYSRVYVADHADLVVDQLPEALDRRISSIHIKPWQYVSKKGWCSTQSDNGIAGGVSTMKASWFYTWSADRTTTADCEYVPIRQHIYWPSMSTLAGKEASTHVLGFNEPDHSEQHDKCDCGGVIDAWKATTNSKDMGTLPMRVGSPAPTDLTWVKDYIGHVDDMAYRCDYVALHAYWGPNEANGAQAWYNRLKDVYDKTKRSIWITEWAYGASWTTETWPSDYGKQLEKNRAAIFDIVNMLESCPFVERYSYYQWDTSSRRFINDDGWVTPAGKVYQKTRSTFAFNQKYQKVPNWWKPSAKASTLAIKTDSRNATFTIGNTNGDLASVIVLERYDKETGKWESVHEWADRSTFDDAELTYTMALKDFDRFSDRFRVKTVTIYGGETVSGMADAGYIVNPDCNDGTNGWTVSNVETAKGEAADGDKDNTYWNQWKQNGLNSSMKQTLKGLLGGEYTLSLLLRASANVTVDVKMTVRSQKGEEQTAVSSFTGHGATSPSDSEWKNGWERLVLDPLMVNTTLDEVTIEVTAKGNGSSWWSADDFRLGYRSKETVGISSVQTNDESDGWQPAYTLDGRRVDGTRAKGIIIQHGKKTYRK